jgi:hypothetical protein
MTYRIIFLVIVNIFVMDIEAQYKTTYGARTDMPSLTGNLNYDLKKDFQQISWLDSTDAGKTIMSENRYSPLRAGLYSALIPGAGQFYTESYWQSAAFFGAEVLTWIIYATYENKGDRQTDLFQKYADEHWSVIRYADWISNNYSSYYDVNIIPVRPADISVEPWKYVNWDKLNVVEEQIGSNGNTTGFTHKLPPHGDQQYYELIGKYAQFGGGWDDAAGFSTGDVIAQNVSAKFLKYSGMRGDANNFYTIASTASFVIVANHVLQG